MKKREVLLHLCIGIQIPGGAQVTFNAYENQVKN